MNQLCPRCGADNFENASQCAQCHLPFTVVNEAHAVPAAERMRRAREFLAAGRNDQAVVQLLPASAAEPNNVEVHRLLAQAYQAKGASPYALRAREAAVRADPNDALAHCELGLAYVDAGRKEEAVAQFNIALQLDPNLQQAKDAYRQLEMVRYEALDRAREMAPAKPAAPAPELAPIVISRPTPLWGTQTGFAVLIAIGVGFAGAFGVGELFRLSSSPELVNSARATAFEQFFPAWVAVLAVILGLCGAAAYGHKVPLVGLVAGAFGGWAAIMVAAAMSKVQVAPTWVQTWVPASVGIAAGVEFLAKVTRLSERKKFLAVAGSLVLIGSVSYLLLNQGRVYGLVRHTVLNEDAMTDEPLAGVEVRLVAVDNPREVYRTTTRPASDAAEAAEWQGSFAFDRVPLKRYYLFVRNPFGGGWVSQSVESEYAITRGTQCDVYVNRKLEPPKPTAQRPGKG